MLINLVSTARRNNPEYDLKDIESLASSWEAALHRAY